jgi:23S rRNA (adenine-N6)-dimethyltransferase
VTGRGARAAPPQGPGRGQHFLHSRALAEELVDHAGVRPGELAVDVGAGHGLLTAALARRGAEVWALEVDRELVRRLRGRHAGRVRVVEADARTFEWPRRPFRVVANLPFAGSREILRGLLGDPHVPLEQAAVILQWEAAVKLAAVWPSTLLSVLWGNRYDLALVRRLPASAFAPPPAVAAGVLRVVRRERPLVVEAKWGAFADFAARAFGSGRPLRALLPPRQVKRLARELGFDADSCARDLDAARLAELFRSVGPGR